MCGGKSERQPDGNTVKQLDYSSDYFHPIKSPETGSIVWVSALAQLLGLFCYNLSPLVSILKL